MAKKQGTAEEKWSRPSMVEWLTFGKVGDNSEGTAFRKVQTVPEASIIDDTTTANTIYFGWAQPGSSTASAVWRIKKGDTTSGLEVTWADGDTNYDNVWDNRASLSYS